MISSRLYIVVTPAKDEEEDLPGLIDSMAKQTFTPVLWVIVDDGSTDNTPKIIEEAQKDHNWIQTIRLKEGRRDIGPHYAYVCQQGFDFAINYCESEGINYNYVGLIDADLILDEAYFEKVMKEFEKNPNLGIASGEVWNRTNGQLVRSKQRYDLPSGGCRLWSKECFKDTGGYLLTYAPDSISNVKAKLRGWDTRAFEEYRVVSTRALGSAEGYWREYKGFGEYNYYVGSDLTFAILKGLRYALSRPYYIGIAYLYGYLSCLLQRKERIDDKEIIEYYRNSRKQEVKNYYLGKLLKKLKKNPNFKN